MSAAQYLIDATTRHQVFLQRYGGGVSKEAQKVLNRLRHDINLRLSREPTLFQSQRLHEILKDIDALSVLAFTKIKENTVLASKKLATVEADFSVELYNKVVKTEFKLPSEGALLVAVQGSAMGAGLTVGVTIDSALRQFGTKKAADIVRVITDGVVLGDTTPQIQEKMSYLIRNLQRRQVAALTNTLINHTASAARDEVYKANKDIMDGYRWVATLDSKTTLVCAGRDGIVFKNPTDPMPPAHFNCRSTTVPVVKPEYSVAGLSGRRPSVVNGKAKTVSSRTTYGGWLKKQPTSFVDEALGKKRSAMFRSGKLSIDKFTDPTGRVYTIEKLKSMNPIVFAEF